jgi:hypothetical protein
MSVRLKVGSYIVDAAESGSTSTTAGARLLQGDSLSGGAPGLHYSQSRNAATLLVPVVVDAANTAALKAAVDAVVLAMLANANADIVYEYSAGSTLADWKVSDGSWSRIEGEVADIDWGDENALILFRFDMQRAGVASSGAGDPVDAITPVFWNFGLDSNGLGSCSGTCTFESRADAAAWVVKMRDGTGWPAWIGTQFRFATAIYQKEQQQNQASPVPDTAFTPATVTVVLSALPSAFAGNSAFDNVVSIEYDAVKSARAPQDENSGEDPGYDITIAGTLQFKTEVDATYDAGDTSQTAGSGLKAAALACLDAIESDAKARLGETWFRASEPVLTVKESGLVVFNIACMTGDSGRITEWNESLQIVVTPRDRGITGSAGVRIHPHRLGPEIRVHHTLAVRAYRQVAYKPPAFISTAWHCESPNPAKPIIRKAAGEGRAEHILAWSNVWRYLGDASGARGKYEYADILGGLS